MIDSFSALTEAVIRFRDDRNWGQFHTRKDNVLSILIEASELAEVVRWMPEEGQDKVRLSEELADVLYWVLLMAHDEGIDLSLALRDKLILNATRYPVDKASGNSLKYDKL